MHDRTKISTVLALLAVLASGCATQRESVTPFEPGGPRFTYDCTLGPNYCDQINVAIVQLETSSNSTCVFAGNMARLRFTAEGYGYRAGDPVLYPQYDAYVKQEPNLLWYSGWGPTDYNTHANPSFFTKSNSQMAGLIAHEEQHQSGWDNPSHTTGIANSYSDQCS